MRRLTEDEKAAILKDIGEGASLNQSLEQLGLYDWLFYDERRLNPDFEAAFMAAAHRGGHQSIQRIRAAAPRIDEERVKRAVLDGLRAGHSLATAYKQAAVTDRTVRRLRMDDAQFNASVVMALEARKQERGTVRCTTPGCGKPHMARGLCGTCYGRDLRRRQRNTSVGAEGAAPRVDEERVKRAVLDGLRAGHSLATAYKEAATSRWAVRRLRAKDPQFGQALFEALHGKRTRALARDQSVITESNASTPRTNATTGRPPRRACTVAGCPETKIKAKGLCVRHYYQQYRTGRTIPGPQTYGRTTCTVPGCGRPHRAKGYCTRCYERHIRQRRRARNGPATVRSVAWGLSASAGPEPIVN